MTLRLVASIAGLIAALVALTPTTGHTSIRRSEPLESESSLPRQWPGGIVSMPIGREHLAYEILDFARDLPQAQDLSAVFLNRGYIRRGDLDVAGGDDSLSFAVLAWQKPDIDIAVEEPMIRLISKNYLDPDLGQRVVATQAFGGVLYDSSGTLTTYTGGADAPACVVEIVPVDTPGSFTIAGGKGPQTMSGDVWAYRFAYRDPGAPRALAKQVLVDAWAATCRFRRSVASVALSCAQTAALAPTGLSVGARMAIGGAGAAAQQWIANAWTCQ